MKLLIALITYNRIAYTQKTLRNLFRTIELPHYLVVVDNASDDGTVEYLKQHEKRNKIDQIVFNDDNFYPGKACNIAWAEGLREYPEATHLMRLDNDMQLEKGWDLAAQEYFKAIPELGQLGLDHEAIEHPKAPLREQEINGKTINPWPGCVGGPCIIRKSLWDMGIRYPELRWDDDRRTPMQEDTGLSRAIASRGYLFGHMTEDLARTFAGPSNWQDYPDYYAKTMNERGYEDRLTEAGL